MTALTDALANIQQIHDNQQALADPATMLWQAQMAWMQAVTAALSSVNPPANATDPNAAVIAQLQQQNATLQEQVAAGEKAVAAFEAIIHPAADSSPSSSEPATIQPTTPGA